jgi:HK97 family phage prohead protease
MTQTTDEHLDLPVIAGDAFTASFGVEITKAEESDDGKVGKVEAIVSAFDVDYRMGFFTWHRITAGAFTESIAKQASIPLFFQHNWDWSEQPPVGTGIASVTTEPKPGLKVAGEFFLDTPNGLATFRAIKAGALREWSIGYRIQDFMIQEDSDNDRKVVVVNRAELWEASSVLRGANPATETLKVAKQMPAEWVEMITEGFASVVTSMDALAERMATFEKAYKGLSERVEAVEHDTEVLLVNLLGASASKASSEPKSGEPVEPAVSGDGETETETAASPPAEAPGSPEPDRLARAEQRAKDRVAAKWQGFIDLHGAGLENGEADDDSRGDIASMERVVRCINHTKNKLDAFEMTAATRVLADSARRNTP